VLELDELRLPYPDERVGGWHSALRATVRTRRGRVRVYVVHLALRAVWRESACSALVASARDTTEPIILCGDFNEPADRPGSRHLHDIGRFEDGWEQASPDVPGLTFPNPERRLRLDRVLLRGGPRAEGAEVLGASAGGLGLYPSDHCGVRVDLDL
jgi:endonuclease/exonuclease/phosphatase family metal-dependent hydrolase